MDLYFQQYQLVQYLCLASPAGCAGSLAADNVTILLTYVVGACTAYMLAYEITGSRPAAFVAGLIYAFYPHPISHRGQLNLLSNQWNPLFALFLFG